ncbi:MAG: methionyl-tRNA formyltransferase, partial [Thermoanaerobaculia bacterium]
PALVVSQPARPAGRGRGEREPAVARRARELGLAVAQPQGARDPRLLDELRSIAPDWAIVVAYGEIFRAELLGLPRRGWLNVHASLLPRWRGAAPIQAAIAAGEPQTGVTIMEIEEGLDSGPLVLQRELAIGPDEQAPELAARLARLGGEVLVEALAGLDSGQLVPRPQDPAAATYAPRLTRADGRVDWRLPAARLYDRWRAFQPWPGLHAELTGEPVKLVRVRPAEPATAAAEPGTIVAVDENGIQVGCGSGSNLLLEELQRPGRRVVAGAEFARGDRITLGQRFA